LPDRQALAAAGYVLAMIAVAWLAAQFYDDPVRRWLGRRLRATTTSPAVQ
jgi:peptidoglycan/LPS O-acetylase OafA/YrhL